MAEWLNLYWKYLLLFIPAIAILIAVFKMAGKAYSRHQRDFHSQEEEMRRLVELKKKYVPLTAGVIESAPQEELLEGTALGIQIMLQKQDDMTAAFRALSKEKQLIYALDVFRDDKTAEKFFKENGSELTSIIADAFELVRLESFTDDIRVLSTMFDENDETTSVDYALVKKTDEKMQAENALTQIKLCGGKYIRDNSELFL